MGGAKAGTDVEMYDAVCFQGITSATEPITIPSRPMKDSECHELNCNGARFGFALANIGDVDRDGYDG